MVRMPVDAAYTAAFRADNCRVLLNKDTQIFYLFSYPGRKIPDLYKTVLMMPEDIVDVLLITFQAVIAATDFSHGVKTIT